MAALNAVSKAAEAAAIGAAPAGRLQLPSDCRATERRGLAGETWIVGVIHIAALGRDNFLGDLLN